MKKIVFALAALSLLSLVSCEKEVDILPEEKPSEAISGNVIKIVARISDDATKTNYDSDGKFTWDPSDQIVVIAHVDGNTNNQKNFTFTTSAGDITNEGRTATFTGTVESGYTVDYAAYPTTLASDNTSSGYNAPFVKVRPDVSGAVSSAMLIGIGDVASGFTFNTAMSLFKINVSGVPASASKLRLVTSDKENYPLDGDFTLVESAGVVTLDFAHYHSEWSGSDAGYQNVDISARGAITGEDFYFNVPIGTYPARTLSIQVLDGSDNVMDEKVITKALTTNRNECLALPALTMDCWETLGNATFYDQFYIDSYQLSAWNHASVPIQRSISNTNKYRLIDPYKAYSDANGYTQPSASDDYLVFTVNKGTGRVTFEDCFTGIRFSSKDYTISYNKWNGTANENPAYNKVIASSAGEPTCVQLAPYYCYKDKTNGYSRYNVNGLIMIIFPDYDDSHAPNSSSLSTSLSPAVTMEGTNVTGFIAALGSTADAARSALGSDVTAVGNTQTVTVPADATATYYVAFKTYFNSGETVTETFPFYCLASAAATSYCKQFNGAYIINYQSGDVGANTITFAASNNPFKGNVMITEFDGLSYDVSENTHASGNSTGFYDGADFSTYSDGDPVYGYYNGTSSYPNVTFYNVMDQVFYYDASGAAHYIVGDSVNTNPASGGTLTNLQFAFGSSTAYYRSTVYTVVCWSRWMGNYWKLGGSAGYDYELFQYGAN